MKPYHVTVRIEVVFAVDEIAESVPDAIALAENHAKHDLGPLAPFAKIDIPWDEVKLL